MSERSLSFLAVFFTISLINQTTSERVAENPVPFRDRNGNIVELNDYVATYKSADSKINVPIFTRVGFDVSRMEIDFQRSYVLLFSGQFRGKIGNPPGNLYILYTEQVKICNGSAVAYEILGDLNLSDLRYDRRNNDLELLFGHSGRMILSKGLLTSTLRNINTDEYIENLYCIENRNVGQNYRGCHRTPMLDVRAEENFNGDYKVLMDDIMYKHNDILNSRLNKLNQYIYLLETKYGNARKLIMQLTQREIDAPKKPTNIIERDEEFRVYLSKKFDDICDLKSGIKRTTFLSDEVTLSNALEWKDESVKCLKNIDRLKSQLEAIRRNTVASRFGGEEETTEDLKVLTPYDAALNTTDYSCIPDKKIKKCIDFLKTNETTAP